jgi:Cys-tRNA(Pro)/Cys-tRNA(Cys) deacylase
MSDDPTATADADAPRGLLAARALGLDVEVRVVGPSESMAAHEAKLGLAPGQLCKTLVVHRGADDLVLVVVPGGRSLDWGLLRPALGVRRASMAGRDEALAGTGYAPGTITPLGAATPDGRTWPVVVDEAAMGFDRIALGSGVSGTSLLVGPHDLVTALDAQVAPVTKPMPAG